MGERQEHTLERQEHTLKIIEMLQNVILTGSWDDGFYQVNVTIHITHILYYMYVCSVESRLLRSFGIYLKLGEFL